MSGDKASKKKIGPGGKKSVVLTKRNYGSRGRRNVWDRIK